MHHTERALLEHNHWANDALIDACARLSADQLDKPFDMSRGSLRAIVTHTLGAMRGWTDVLAKRDQRERLDENHPYTPQDWSRMEPEIHAQLVDAALSGPMDEILTPERQGQTHRFVRAHVIAHVTTHGVHHRAQCIHILKQLGADPLPKSSVVEWMLQRPGCTD